MLNCLALLLMATAPEQFMIKSRNTRYILLKQWCPSLDQCWKRPSCSAWLISHHILYQKSKNCQYVQSYVWIFHHWYFRNLFEQRSLGQDENAREGIQWRGWIHGQWFHPKNNQFVQLNLAMKGSAFQLFCQDMSSNLRLLSPIHSQPHWTLDWN